MATRAPPPQSTSIRAAAFSAATVCTGEGCTARDPWPLHHVKHRGVFCRLCTACVLKHHPSHFCSLCLDLISDSPNSSSIISCSSCNNVCHSSCLPPSSSSSSPDFFLCPDCSSNPGERDRDSKRRVIDLACAKSMLCAARISAVSMSRAASQAKADAERKVKEAIGARKRAREMLESVIAVAKREKERKIVASGEGREREKVMRFYSNNNNEGIGGLERKIAPLNSRVGKVEEQVESKDIKPMAVLPKRDGNQNS